MNDVTAINSAEQKLVQLLKSELSKIPGLAGSDVTPENPAVLLSGWKTAAGTVLSVFLYLVEVDTSSRHEPYRRISTGAPSSAPPLPLNLHFLVTPIASQSDDAHLLLNAAMDILHRTPVVPIDSPSEEKKTLEVTLNPLSLEEVTRLWIAMGTPYRLSVSYKATVR